MSCLELILDSIGGNSDRIYTVLKYKVDKSDNSFELDILKFKLDDLINFIYKNLEKYVNPDADIQGINLKISDLSDAINKIINNGKLTIFDFSFNVNIFIYNEWETPKLKSNMINSSEYSLDSYLKK